MDLSYLRSLLVWTTLPPRPPHPSFLQPSGAPEQPGRARLPSPKPAPQAEGGARHRAHAQARCRGAKGGAVPGGWAVWNCHPLPGQVGPLEPSEQHGTRRSSASWVAAPAGPGAAAVPWTLCVRFRTGRAVFTPTEAAGAARMARRESNPVWGQELGCPTVSVNHNVDMANPQSRKLPGSEDPREQVPGAHSPTLGPPRPDVAPKAKGSHMQGKPDSGLLCPHTLPSSTSGRWYGLPCPLLHGATTPPFRVQRVLKRPRALRTCS